MIEPTPPVAIIMGSQSDWNTMRHAADTLDPSTLPMTTGLFPPTARRTG